MFYSGRLLSAVAAVGLVAGPLAPPASADVACVDRSYAVTLAGTTQTMAGRLCVPAGARAVQVLIPGGTYTSAYWDTPYDAAGRSFRLAANARGYATLTVDRLGTGRGSRPPSALVTAVGQADAVHQVVQALRADFDRVVLGGHSLGSAIAMMEAGTYRDVDAVLITGMAHRLSVLGTIPLFTSLVPAVTQPGFADRDPGYLTTRPGTRYTSFHSPGPLDAAVLDTDEATKDVIAPGEVVDGALIGAVLPYSRLIDVPVLIALGDDPSFCGLLGTDCSTPEALRRSESPYYPASVSLTTYVHHGYGHAINLAPDAHRYHDFVLAWADSVLG